MHRRLVPLVVAVLTVAGCGGSTPTSPGSSSPVGTWSGSISDPGAGSGTLEVTLTEATNGFAGPWSATFPNGTTSSGLAGLSLMGPGSYSMTLYADPQPACDVTSGPGASALLGYILSNVGVTPSRMTAMSIRLNCNGPGGFGSLSLSRR